MTIIIYGDADSLGVTVDDLTNKTPSVEIVVCDDTNKIGFAKTINAVAMDITGPLIVVRAPFKVTPGWLEPLVAKLDDGVMVSPIVHDLDVSIWQLSQTSWRRVGWRWDLMLYDRGWDGTDLSPSASPFCVAFGDGLFRRLGGFDELADGYEVAELSLRNWLQGGKVCVADESIVGSLTGSQIRDNVSAAKIMHKWFPEHLSKFYAYNSVTSVNTGRITDSQCDAEQVNQWLQERQPELLNVFDLYQSAVGKSVAVVGDGPSLDMLDVGILNKYDVLIVIDSIAHLFDCDYVVSNSLNAVVSLRDQFHGKQFVLPSLMFNGSIGHNISVNEVVEGCVAFEHLPYNTLPSSIFPPFCHFDSAVLTAAHFALFLRPRSVTVFGCDFKTVAGRSHTAVVEQWNETDAGSRFAVLDSALRKLGVVAASIGIPLFRMNHA